MGGTCVNTGCTPTKTLVASAQAAYAARRAAEYGVVIPGEVRVDLAKAKGARPGGGREIAVRAVEAWAARNEELHVRWKDTPGSRPRIGCAWATTYSAPPASSSMSAGGRRSPASGPRPGAVSDQPLHARAGRGARKPRGRGWQLHRPRVRADVSPLRSAGDRGRDATSPHRARGCGRLGGDPGDPGRRGRQGTDRRHLHQAREARAGNRGGGRLPERRARGGRIARPSLAVGRQAQHRRPRPRQGRRGHGCRAGTSSVDESLATNVPRHLGARRLQRPRCFHPHRLQRLRDRGRQPARRPAAHAQRPHPGLRPLHRPAARAGGEDRGRSACLRRPVLAGSAPDDPRVAPRSKKGKPGAS
jgi:hypothetical protein